MNIKQKKLFFLLSVLISLSSCSSKKDVVYFSDVNAKDQDKIVFESGRIQPNDILNIVVASTSAELSSLYNLNQSPTSPSTGYLVNTEGTITMPVLGKIKAQGLTLTELENLVAKQLRDGNHLADPIVTARLTNAKFTVLGEVNKPGTYNFTEENISILQALGYAGDLTINGRRQNILIIREENNTKSYTTIDLTSKQWFSSPYYYIKPNDVVYVTPNGAKVKQAGYIGSLGTFMAVASIALSTVLTIIVVSK